MRTKISVLLFILLLSGLFTGPFLLAAEISSPVTTYSNSEGYSTHGQISLSSSKEKIDAVLWNFADYENWLLDGLTREDPDAKKLTCTLNDMKYLPEENQFKIHFSLNFWFLRNWENSIKFSVNTMDDGTEVIKLDVVKDYDNGGKISFENVKAIPVISHYEGTDWNSLWYNCAVYPYGDYTDDMFARHMMYQQAGVNRNVLQNYINYIPEEFLAYE